MKIRLLQPFWPILLLFSACETNINIDDFINFEESLQVSVAIKDCNSFYNTFTSYVIEPKDEKWNKLLLFSYKHLEGWTPSASMQGDVYITQGSLEVVHNSAEHIIAVNFVDESKKSYHFSKKIAPGELDFLVSDYKMSPITTYGIECRSEQEKELIRNLNSYLIYHGRKLTKESDPDILMARKPYLYNHIYWNSNRETATWIEIFPNKDNKGNYYNSDYKECGWIIYTKIDEMNPSYNRNETECFIKKLLIASGFKYKTIKKFQ